MNHLDEDELVDLVDGALPAARAAHVDGCDRCRVQAEDLRVVLREARSVDVPEPSPLFWEHFSARVRDEVAREERGAAPAWGGWLRARVIPGVALLGVVIALVVTMTRWRAPTRDHVDSARATTGSADVSDAESLETPEWALMVNVTQDLEWEERQAADLMVRPGTAERALLQLSPDERRELVRLLRAELERPHS